MGTRHGQAFARTGESRDPAGVYARWQTAHCNRRRCDQGVGGRHRKELPGIVDTGPFAGEMAIAGDGQTLLTLGNDGKARVWDLRGRKLVRTHDGLGGIRALAITPDGRHVVTAGSQLVVWHAGTGKLVRKLDDSHGPFTTLALSPDGRFLFAAVSSRQAWLWDLSWLEQGSLP